MQVNGLRVASEYDFVPNEVNGLNKLKELLINLYKDESPKRSDIYNERRSLIILPRIGKKSFDLPQEDDNFDSIKNLEKRNFFIPRIGK